MVFDDRTLVVCVNLYALLVAIVVIVTVVVSLDNLVLFHELVKILKVVFDFFQCVRLSVCNLVRVTMEPISIALVQVRFPKDFRVKGYILSCPVPLITS